VYHVLPGYTSTIECVPCVTGPGTRTSSGFSEPFTKTDLYHGVTRYALRQLKLHSLFNSNLSEKVGLHIIDAPTAHVHGGPCGSQ
jgi:hypothetical protein